jgi:hypothetical protein
MKGASRPSGGGGSMQPRRLAHSPMADPTRFPCLNLFKKTVDMIGREDKYELDLNNYDLLFEP